MSDRIVELSTFKGVSCILATFMHLVKLVSILMLAEPFTRNKNSLDKGSAFKSCIVLKDQPLLSTPTVHASIALYSTGKRGDEPSIVTSVETAGSGRHPGQAPCKKGEQEGSCMHSDDITMGNTEEMHHDSEVGEAERAPDAHGALLAASKYYACS